VNDWVRQQATSLRDLTGRTVVRWLGSEMALREVGANGLPDWRDPTVPFLQLDRLDLILADGSVARTTTYQNDCTWGICRDDTLPPLRFENHDPYSIFRDRSLDELPTGAVRSVAIAMNSGDIAEVKLDVDGREVRLRAGEVYEQLDGSLLVNPDDESILVQVDGKRP
jgi:hypothetical protein